MTKELVFTGSEGRFKLDLLHAQLAHLWPNPVTTEGTSRLHGKPDGSEVYIFADDDTDEQTVQAVIDAHDPTELSQAEIENAKIEDAQTNIQSYPDWAFWTADEAEQHVIDNVVSGFTKQEMDDWIDSNVTDLASAVTALKLLGGGIVDLRNMLSKIAKMIMWIRDLIAR